MSITSSLTRSGFLDAYSRRARLSPVLLVALPAVLLSLALVPSLPDWHKLWPVLAGCGVIILLDQLGRDAGRRLQPDLWASWGGAPATAALRHRGTPNPVLLARRHEQLGTLMGQPLPTEPEEQQDPAAADHAYAAAVAYLISRTRSRDDFPLIFVENCHYGFRRNLLGLRRWGLQSSAASAIAAALGLALVMVDVVDLSAALLVGVLAVSVVAFVLWQRVVTPAWVKRAAEAYAERLLEAAERLSSTA
jgi:hypothetical protein